MEMGGPVWSHAGIICTGETYKNAVKLTFAKGASVEDPSASSTPASKATPGVPSISIRATRSMKKAFKALIRAAAGVNTASAALRPAKKT
jgi:hypothetical protein